MLHAQNYVTLIDRCVTCLEEQDTIAFNALYPSIYDAYAEEYNEFYSISKELEQIRLAVQSLRLFYLEVLKKRGTNDSLSVRVRNYVDDMDRKNAVRAEAILNEYGWLTTDKVSENANEGLFLMVQHCNNITLQSSCLSALEKLLDEYPSEKYHYAFLTDRFAMNQGKEQIYGTQKIVKNGFPYIIPLKYPDKVEELRLKMGLPSLWEELSDEYGGTWNLDFYYDHLTDIKTVYKHYRDKHNK